MRHETYFFPRTGCVIPLIHPTPYRRTCRFYATVIRHCQPAHMAGASLAVWYPLIPFPGFPVLDRLTDPLIRPRLLATDHLIRQPLRRHRT
jgi:hypothetical protein